MSAAGDSGSPAAAESARAPNRCADHFGQRMGDLDARLDPLKKNAPSSSN
jgi:hypothetical protein